MGFVGQEASIVAFEAADDFLKQADARAGAISAKLDGGGIPVNGITSDMGPTQKIAVGRPGGTGAGLGGDAGGTDAVTLTELAQVQRLMQTGTTMASMGAASQQQEGKALSSAAGG